MTDAELAAERLAALLDAERENTALRAEIAELRAREEWLAHAVEATDAGRCDDRDAVVKFLRERGHDVEAEAIAKAGYPLWACLPLVNVPAI